MRHPFVARSASVVRVVVVVASLVSADVHARAPSPDDVAAARAALQAGLQAYDRKAFAEAQAHFERAHGLNPTPASLYAWAQAARSAGDCETAVGLYRRFVDEGATGDSREAALKNEARCREVSAKREAVVVPTPVEPSPAGDPSTVPAPTVPRESDDVGHRRPRRIDRAGIALVSTGAVVAVTGIVLIGVAESLRAKQSATRDYDRFDALDGRIDGLHIAGGVTLGVGAALAIVGGVRLGLARKRDRTVWLSPRFDGGSGMLVLGFSPRRASVE